MPRPVNSVEDVLQKTFLAAWRGAAGYPAPRPRPHRSAGAVLDATADLLNLLSDFFTGTDSATRPRLGGFLVDRYGPENTTDSVTEAAVLLDQLSDAAELLHALADRSGAGDKLS